MALPQPRGAGWGVAATGSVRRPLLVRLVGRAGKPDDDGSAQCRVQAAQIMGETLSPPGARWSRANLTGGEGGEGVLDLVLGPRPGRLAEQVGLALRHSRHCDGAEPAEPSLLEDTVRAAAAGRRPPQAPHGTARVRRQGRSHTRRRARPAREGSA
ncbi:hypothetical protein F8B43_1541 [Methylorubrum populi]|uniref:Uncharacterized protein n=1 Tax=Methylorubrum populi TaxID=223967 RepID=A0A833J7I5_9HYPH|nr:hypothetical protein F8B43_1541 [Methylorubrum populi]